MRGATREARQPPSLLSQFAWILPSRVIATLLQAAVLVLLARWAGPRDFGLVVTVVAVTTVVATTTDFGLSGYISLLRTADPADPRIRSALKLNNRTSSILSVGSLLALVVLGQWEPTLLLAAPLGLWVGAERNITAWATVAVADGTTRLNAVSAVTLRAGTLLLFVAAQPVAGPVLAFATSSAVCSLTVAHVLRRRIEPSIASGNLPSRLIIRQARHYWATTALTQLRQLDTLVVTAAAGSTTVVGIYAIITRLTGPIQLVPRSLAPLLLPHARRNRAEPRAALLPTLSGVLGLMAVLLALLAWQADLLIVASVGSSYAAAVEPLRVVCAGLLFASASTLMNASMQGLGFERAVASLSGVVSGCVLLGVGIGAHVGAATGAAVGLSTAYVIQCVLTAGVFARALRRRAAPREP